MKKARPEPAVKGTWRKDFSDKRDFPDKIAPAGHASGRKAADSAAERAWRAAPAAIAPEDQALWVHVTRSAKPLRGRAALVMPELAPAIGREMAAPTKPAKPVPAVARARTLPPLAGIEKRVLRDLTRGARTIDLRIDLHGMRQAEAHGALVAFVHRAQAQGAKLVLVITGKGGPQGFGDERGVLRRLVPHWLAEPGLRRLIIGYESAARGHGGEGAYYVRIRRVREPA